MADENPPRDASAKDVLKAAQELKPELAAVRRELADTRGELRGAKPGEPTVPKGGRAGAGAAQTEAEVKRATRSIEEQRVDLMRVGQQFNLNTRYANDHLSVLKRQAEELRQIHRLSQFSGPTVFPTGRTPFSAGGRPVTGDPTQIRRSLAEAQQAATAARDALLIEQTMRQRLAAIAAPASAYRSLQTVRQFQAGTGGLILPPGAGGPPAPPPAIIVPEPGLRTSPTTPGERAAQAATAARLRASQAARQAVRDEAAEVAQLAHRLVQVRDYTQQRVRASMQSTEAVLSELVATEKLAAADARVLRERMAAKGAGMAPGERRLAAAEYLGTPYGPLEGMAGIAPGSEQRPAPFPIHQVNRGPAFEARAAEAEFGTYRSAKTAAGDVAALNSELTRLGTVQAAASQQMRRHGALTTEFLTALARGETTVQEFGYHLTATAGKFAGWTAAAGGVYGLLNALGRLKQGAIDTSSGVNVVSRVIQNFNTDDAQRAFTDLSRQFNVPVETAVDAVYRMGQRFHSLPEAVEAARASLYSFKTGEVDVATSTENLLAIVNGFHLGASDLKGVYDQINQAQNTFGIRIGDTEAGLAKAAGTYRNAGGDLNYLLAVMTAIGRATNRSGQEIGTGIARGVNEIRKPINQAKLEAEGVKVDPQNFQKTLKSAMEAARRPGADLQRIASGLFGNQYARLIAPVLADQKTLNDAIKDTSPEASKGSAQKELAKVLKQTNEQLSALGNGLERVGGLMAQAGAFDVLGGALHILRAMEGSVEHILQLFNDIPAPLRHTLVILGEMRLMTRLIGRSQVGAALADTTGLSFLGPNQTERARREAIIGTRHAEQTASSAFESTINTAAMTKTQAAAQRNLAIDLETQAAVERNEIARIALQERSNVAMAKYEELTAQANAQEQLALQYQEAYTTATERRVALQKRQISAEEALAASAVAYPGGVLPMAPGAKPAPRSGALVTPVTAAEQLAFFGSGVGRTEVNAEEWARRNAVGDPIHMPTRAADWRQANARVDLGAAGEQLALFGPNVGEQTRADKVKGATRDASEQMRRKTAGLRLAGAEIKAAGGRLASGITGFVDGMGRFGLAFTAFIIGDEIRSTIDKATKGIEAQNQALDAVPHSLEDLQNRAFAAQQAARHGKQHSTGAKIADFLTSGQILGPYVASAASHLLTGEGTQAEVQSAADRARANADQALIHARDRTRHSNVQNVGLANKEIVKIAEREGVHAREWGQTREDVNKAFDRYVRDVGVSIEGMTTGKTDPKVVAALKVLRQQALSQFGGTKGDPFAAFRGGVDEALTVMASTASRAGTFGTSGKDLDQLMAGAMYVTAKYGASNEPKDIQKVQQAQAAIDGYINQMADDLKASNAAIERHGSQRDLRRSDITPAYLRGQANFAQRGTDQNYAEYIRSLEHARDHAHDNIDKVSEGLRREQAAVDYGERVKRGDAAQQILPEGMPTGGAALDRWIASHKKKLQAERDKVKKANDAADRRAEKIQAQIDAAQEQQYQETTNRIQVRSAYAQTLATDKSDAIAKQIEADGRLVQEALRYHGPHRWEKIMAAMTQQNNDIAAQAEQNLQDIQNQTELHVSQVTAAGPAADRQRLDIQLAGARQALRAARAEAPNINKKDHIRTAEIGVNNILHDINEQAVQDAKDAHDLAQQLYESKRAIELAGITDPTRRLQVQLQTDRHALGLIRRGDFKRRIEFQIARNNQLAKIRQDQTDLQQQHISDEYDTASFEHDMGKLTDDAYIRQLRQIVKMKGITKQTKRQLLLEIHRATEENAGDLELNVGNIHLPTIYEIRRAMGGRSQRFGGGGQMVVHSNPTVNINVANSSDVPGVGDQVEGAVNGPVRANMRAAGLIG